MGETALSPDDTAEGKQTEAPKPNESDKSSEEDGEEAPAAPEVEIVLQGEDGSQPDPQHGIRKRINKLNVRIAEGQTETSQVQALLNTEQEKNKLLQLALAQKTTVEQILPPDPVDFNDGAKDPNYAKALRDFNRSDIAAEVERQTASLRTAQSKSPADAGLERMQKEHYERAVKLGVRDFDETEDKAIEILGTENVNHLIQMIDESELVLYHLGKNPDKAEEFKALIDVSPGKAVARLGRLGARLSAKPKANFEPAPDPDNELQGGAPSAGTSNKFQKKLDKARTAAQDGGKMGEVMKIKREAKAAGVTLT